MIESASSADSPQPKAWGKVLCEPRDNFTLEIHELTCHARYRHPCREMPRILIDQKHHRTEAVFLYA